MIEVHHEIAGVALIDLGHDTAIEAQKDQEGAAVQLLEIATEGKLVRTLSDL